MTNQQEVLQLQASGRADGRTAIEACRGDQVLTRDTVDLQSAEDRRRCAAVIREAAPTFEVDAIERELMNLDPERLPPANGGQVEWREPDAVERPPVPLFPVDVLPEPLRSFVSDTAEACQVPADLPALLSLAVCSGAAARRIAINPSGAWVEPINLFAVCFLEPANRKTSVFTSTTRPLLAIERELVEAAAPTLARLRSDRRIREKELIELERKAAKGCEERSSLSAASVVCAVLRKFWRSAGPTSFGTETGSRFARARRRGTARPRELCLYSRSCVPNSTHSRRLPNLDLKCRSMLMFK